MTIHPTNHIDYSKGPRVDHLFVVDGDEGTALLVSVTDTGLDCVLEGGAGWRDRPRTKGWSLTWAEVFAAVQESDHNGVVKLTTVRSTADDEHVSRCGYCGDVIDYCQGHSEDEQSEFGFAPDSDEYDARREAFESVDESTEDPRLCDCGKGDWCPLWDSWHGPGKTAWRLRMNNEEALTNG